MLDPIIELAWGDIMMAAHVGIMRRTSGIFKERSGKYGASGHGRHWWGIDIEAAIAEMAVSRYYNLSWEGAIGDTDAVDVGGQIQVRSVEMEHHRLMLHKKDKDWEPFVLAMVKPPNVYLRGWCYARDGKKEEWWKPQKDKNHNGEERWAYFVPTEILRHASELHEWLK